MLYIINMYKYMSGENAIIMICNKFSKGKGVVLGSSKADLSKEIASAWNGTLYMVDRWGAPESNARYSEVIESISGLEARAIMVRASSEAASDIFSDGSIDFVYIDSGKTYDCVTNELELWHSKVKTGGYICGSNYIRIDWNSDPNFAENKKDKFIWNEGDYMGVFGVNPAVDEFCERNGCELKVTDELLGSWHIEKKGDVAMNIIFYSDANYEYQAKSLIESIMLNVKEKVRMIYYTIGFESSLEFEGLVKVAFDIDPSKQFFEFYKPSIMLDAISRFGGHFLFLDTDIIIGRRFCLSKIKNDLDIPLFPHGNWDHPFAFQGVNPDGSYISVSNEKSMMEYFGVKERSMGYIYTCVCSFNEKCEDVISEWKSMCENSYLLQQTWKYYTFKDETPMNVILWKRRVTQNLGRIYLNTLHAEPLTYVEENEGVVGTAYNMGIFDSPYMKCENSSDIMLYHGIKERGEIEAAISYMRSKSEKNQLIEI